MCASSGQSPTNAGASAPLTREGRTAFHGHVAALRAIVDSVD